MIDQVILNEWMVFRFIFVRYPYSGGQIIPLEQGSILLLVGPNNSGKSTALRDIANSLLPRGGFVPSPSKIVRSIEFSDDLDFPAVRAWAEKLYKTTTLSDGTLRIELGSSSQPVLIGENTPGPDLYRSLAPGLMQRLGTEERLNYANSTNRIDLRAAAPQRPIHWLQKDDKLAKGISEIIHNAFGGSLIIDWGAGQQVAFHVGDEPLRSPGCDRVSQRYMEELDKLPRLETLGDGIRSFVACILAAHVGSCPIDLPRFSQPVITEDLSASANSFGVR